jgi:hypothetical protein
VTAIDEMMADECYSCGEEGADDPEMKCSQAKRPCGHHCNCIWVHDHCHWCEAEINEEGELVVPKAAT